MLDTDTKRRIDTARDILVGKVPDPKSQVEQITIALIYKFMDDMDAESEELGGKRKFFTKEFARYGWAQIMRAGLGGHEMLGLYAEGITKMPENPGIPLLFRDIFKNAYLPYRDPETLKAFLKIIDEFSYDHSERLGDAFEYLLSVLGSQGDAGQFRTPRHIIDFIVEVLAPQKHETILDPACGTAGFLISAYKHILRANTSGERRVRGPGLHPVGPVPQPGGRDDAKNAGSGDPAYNKPREDDAGRVPSHGVPYLQPTCGLIVPKEKIAANGDYNLSGERYREGGVRTSNYSTVPIGDICELFNGRAFKPEDWEGSKSGGIPIVRIQNLNNADSSFNYFTGEVSDRNTINNGELLFSWSGSRGASFGAHIWKGEKAVLNQHIFKVAFDESRATKMYLLHALNKAVAEVEENLHGGVGLVHITKGNLEKIEIPLPPLEVQKEIVAEIEGYQKVINGARAVLGHYRPHIPIHPDWPMVKLGEVCGYAGGTQPPKETFISEPREGYIRLLQIRHYKSDDWMVYIPKSERHKTCEPEDVMIGRYGPPVFQILKGKRGAYNVALIKCIPDLARLERMWLFHFLRSPRVQETVIALSGRVRQSGVNPADLDELEIPLPPLATQQAIVAEIEAEQALVAANRELITRFEQKIQATLARIWGKEAPWPSGGIDS